MYAANTVASDHGVAMMLGDLLLRISRNSTALVWPFEVFTASSGFLNRANSNLTGAAGRSKPSRRAISGWVRPNTLLRRCWCSVGHAGHLRHCRAPTAAVEKGIAKIDSKDAPRYSISVGPIDRVGSAGRSVVVSVCFKEQNHVTKIAHAVRFG